MPLYPFVRRTKPGDDARALATFALSSLATSIPFSLAAVSPLPLLPSEGLYSTYTWYGPPLRASKRTWTSSVGRSGSVT